MTETAQASGAGSNPETQVVVPPANGSAGKMAKGDRQNSKLKRQRSIMSMVSAQDSNVGSALNTEKVKRDLREKFTSAFAKRVITDSEESRLTGQKLAVHKVIGSAKFDTAIGVIIIVNSVVIGLESSNRLEGQVEHMGFYKILEYLFLVIYSVELALRFYAYGLRCLRNEWVMFDFFLVMSGLIGTVLTSVLDEFSQGKGEGFLNVVLLLRLFRLARLARMVRLLAQFKVLWMLVRGLLSGGFTMLYVSFLFLVLLYIFACIGVEIITQPHFLLTDAERAENLLYDSIVTESFESIPITMLTLFRIAFGDSAGSTYIPMIKHRPILVVYFLVYIFFIGICLLNLVTAVIVETSLEQASQDKEHAKIHKAHVVKKTMPELRALFKGMDKDQDNQITLEEFGQCDVEVQETLYHLFQTDDLVELFEILDVDGGGSVSIDEFFDEMLRLVTTETPMSQIRLIKQVAFIRSQVFGLTSGQTNILHCMARLNEALHNIEALTMTDVQKASKDSCVPPPPDVQTLSELRAPQPALQAMLTEDVQAATSGYACSPCHKSAMHPAVIESAPVEKRVSAVEQRMSTFEQRLMVMDERQIQIHDGVQTLLSSVGRLQAASTASTASAA
jgi:voltage-gated sodium channel